MRKNYKNTLLSLFILMTGALFLVSGISYAFLSYQGIGNKNSNITSSGITFNYKEKSNYISLNEVMPMTDEQGKAQNDYFEFDIASTGVTNSFYIPYDIVLKKTSSSDNIEDAIKIYLTKVEANNTEKQVVLTNFDQLGSYINQLTNAQGEKFLYKDSVKQSDYRETYRLRIWIDYDTDFTESKYNNATFGISVNVYSKGEIRIEEEEPGLYNSENVLIASWDSLVNDYELDVETDYESGEDYDLDRYATAFNNHMLGKIFNNNQELKQSKKLVIGNINKIGNYALIDCDNLSEIVIPSSVTSIGNGAFYQSKITTIDIPSSVTSIGNSAFYQSNITTIDIPSSVTSIGNSVFGYCVNLTEINLPSSVTSIGERAFENCVNLTEINLPSSVTSIGNSAFNYCVKLTEINLPSSVTSIADYAFYNCAALQTLEIPSSVTSIGGGAFADCTNLETVTLEEPSQLSEIGIGAFDNTKWFSNESLNGTPKLNDITVLPYPDGK